MGAYLETGSLQLELGYMKSHRSRMGPKSDGWCPYRGPCEDTEEAAMGQNNMQREEDAAAGGGTLGLPSTDRCWKRRVAFSP